MLDPPTKFSGYLSKVLDLSVLALPNIQEAFSVECGEIGHFGVVGSAGQLALPDLLRSDQQGNAQGE